MTANNSTRGLVASLACVAAVLAGACSSPDPEAADSTLLPDGSGPSAPELPEAGSDPDVEVEGEIVVAGDDGSSELLGGINGSALEKRHGQAVVMVLTRGCDGMGYGRGTGFAIAPDTIVTNWHVVAEHYDPDAPIDPRPWILTYNRRWVRGTVIGASPTPDIAVIKLDTTEPTMVESLDWLDADIGDGEHVAVLGYPALESGEFNLAVGETAESDGENRSIASFRINRSLSSRTGPGNSGGPVLTTDGSVAGVLTWGQMSRSTWYAQDATVVQDAVESMLDDEDTELPVACDDDERYPLSYTVRLGTFADEASAQERLDVVDDVRDDVEVINVSSDSWQPFLLSDYPIVMMAGPFDTREAAAAAVEEYQAAIDAAGQSDRFSYGVMPRSVFGDRQQEAADRSCGDLSGSTVDVTGVTPADPLKLRAEPSTGAAVLAELDEGVTLALLDSAPVEANGLEWLPVQHDGDGGPLCGWVAKRYTTAP